MKHCFEHERNRYKTILSLLSDDDNDSDYFNPIIQDLDVTHLKSNNNYSLDQFIGPCHGLIAMMDSVTTILINPSTRNYRLLPPDQFIGCQKDYYRSIQNVGFGYDSITNDYKVIRISIIYMTDRDDYPEKMDRIVDIYDLSVDSWRKLDGGVVQQLSMFYCVSCSQMFYRGICHWVASQDIDGNIDEYSGSGCLMSYNHNSNVVKGLSFHGVPQSFRVICYKDSLTSIPRENEHTTQVHKF
ncbi:hypothetical protein RDI58_001107 [Solanum bulbocastanum]|uniref:F-box associated beta-propeller type 1 domain-containing protein n=1 Tax=Solanum bulbocastanum TaxID=147425 RepID=A0AAN8YMW7_SOLBU